MDINQASTIGGYRMLLNQRNKDLEYIVSVEAKWKAMQPMMDSELPKAVLFFEMLEKWLDDLAKNRPKRFTQSSDRSP